MKNTLFVVGLLASLTVAGQNGTFLQPYAGIGLTNFKNYNGEENSNTRNAFSFDFGALAGLEHNHWQFYTGLVYMRTGARVGLTETDLMGNPIGTVYEKLYINHFGVPLGAGRSFILNDKVTFTPSIELTVTYNPSGRENLVPGGSVQRIPNDEFEYTFDPLSVFGGVRATFGYKIARGLSVTAAPMFQYMFTNLLKSYQNSNNPTMYCRAMTLNFGLKWNFGKAKKTDTKVKKEE